METNYNFKRRFYYDVEDTVKKQNVTFILGPRRCGKTVCMKQLQDTFSSNNDFEKVIYIDAKREPIPTFGKNKFIDDIIDAINENKKTLFLIDEATYINNPDWSIMDIQDAFTSCNNTNTKVVFTGSQSKALSSWGHQAFAGDAAYIYADFLSYPEWLAYKNISEPSEENYQQFLKGTREFYKNFNNTREYLTGCLDETVRSNANANNIIYGNDCSEVTVDKLLDVLYASLVTLHNRTNYSTFVSPDYLEKSIKHHFAQNIDPENDMPEIHDKIAKHLADRYRSFKSMTSRELKQSLQFLNNCGLITTTYVSDDLDANAYVCQSFLSPYNDNFNKEEVMGKINTCIKYPMFYVDLLQDVMGNKMPDKLNNALLGSIVECHVRGLLPSKGAIEYRDEQENEIDYVNTSRQSAIEISISNKKLSATHLSILPDNYEKIVLSKDITDTKNNIKYIPYYQFIYDNSDTDDIIVRERNRSLSEIMKKRYAELPDSNQLNISEQKTAPDIK